MKIFPPLALALLMLSSLSACSDASHDASETAPAPSTEVSNPLEGAWEVVYSKAVFPDSTVVRDEGTPFELKLFTPRHHTYIMRDAEGAFVTAGGGSYTFEGDTLTETHAYQFVPEWVGYIATWNVRFEQDTFYLTGPVKVVTAQGEDVTEEILGVLGQLEETFRRVK